MSKKYFMYWVLTLRTNFHKLFLLQQSLRLTVDWCEQIPSFFLLDCFCSALEPSSLAKAIYPVLISYSSPDKQAFPRHTLSRAALIMSESPIFLLDAFTNLIVYYSPTADPSIAFPPPRDCEYIILHFVMHVLSIEALVLVYFNHLFCSHTMQVCWEQRLIDWSRTGVLHQSLHSSMEGKMIQHCLRATLLKSKMLMVQALQLVQGL